MSFKNGFNQRDHIFLSYASADWEYAKKAVTFLRLNGYNVWFTRNGDNMEYSKPWLGALAEKIEDCAFFMCLLSKNYSKSEYCAFEFARAFSKPLIPVRLEEEINSQLIEMVVKPIQSFEWSTFFHRFLGEERFFSCKNGGYIEMFDYNALKKFNVEKENLFFHVKNAVAPLDYSKVEDFSENLQIFKEEAFNLGYYAINEEGEETVFNELRPLLRKAALVRGEGGAKLHFWIEVYENGRYLEQKAIRTWAIKNGEREIAPIFSKGVGAYGFEKAIWSIMGGGVWCVTKDNYLLYSFRTKKVGEYAECYGYSAAGGYGIDNELAKDSLFADPLSHMVEEVETELGVKIGLKDLRILTVGLDATRALVQFSYFSKLPLTLNEVMERHKTCVEKDELEICFTPMTKEKVGELIFGKEFSTMEPGAQASLKHLLENLDELL